MTAKRAPATTQATPIHLRLSVGSGMPQDDTIVVWVPCHAEFTAAETQVIVEAAVSTVEATARECLRLRGAR